MGDLLKFEKREKTKEPEKTVDKSDFFVDNIERNKLKIQIRKEQIEKENKRVKYDYKLNK
jgi:hypothetical protein